MSNIPQKISRIFDKIKIDDDDHNGQMYRKHYAVAVRNNKVITPLVHNYYRTNVFGKVRGTIHAEMNALNNVLNADKSCDFINHKVQGQYVLQPYRERSPKGM